LFYQAHQKVFKYINFIVFEKMIDEKLENNEILIPKEDDDKTIKDMIKFFYTGNFFKNY
jgi:hypothetical protein